MAWLHDVLHRMVKTYVPDNEQNQVFESMIATLLIGCYVKNKTGYFHRYNLLETFNIDLSMLSTYDNFRLLRQFDLKLKRMTFETIPAYASFLVDKLTEKAYKEFLLVAKNLEVISYGQPPPEKEIREKEAQACIKAMITDNLSYFKHEEEYFSLEFKLGILSRMQQFFSHDRLNDYRLALLSDENSADLSLSLTLDINHPSETKIIQTFFFGLCEIYTKLEEDDCCWLSDFSHGYLQVACLDKINSLQESKLIISSLSMIERCTLYCLHYDISIDLAYFAKSTLISAPKPVVSSIFREIQQNEWDPFQDRYVIKTEARTFSWVLCHFDVPAGERLIFRYYLRDKLKKAHLHNYYGEFFQNACKTLMAQLYGLITKHYPQTKNSYIFICYLDYLQKRLIDLHNVLPSTQFKQAIQSRSMFAKKRLQSAANLRNKTLAHAEQNRQIGHDPWVHIEKNNDTATFFV